MKARLLTKLLNDTKYTVNNNKEYIAVGSPLCHNLISVNKETLKIKYALDAFREGREALTKDGGELLFIWDKLQELIDNGLIKDIIEGDDEIEIPLPVYFIEDGELIETITDAYGYPNTTASGEVMDSSFFKTKKEAIKYGIKELECSLRWAKESLIEKEAAVQKQKDRITLCEGYISHLKTI